MTSIYFADLWLEKLHTTASEHFIHFHLHYLQSLLKMFIGEGFMDSVWLLLTVYIHYGQHSAGIDSIAKIGDMLSLNYEEF